MFRTRDFVLLFTVIVFLLAAIGATLLQQWRGEVVPTGPVLVWPAEDAVLAELPSTTTVSRADRIQALRQKIATTDLGQWRAANPPLPAPLPSPTSSPASTSQATTSGGALWCPGAGQYRGFWDSRGVTVTPAAAGVVVARAVGTTTQQLLLLPRRTLPAGSPSCLVSDVIGIANDGSLLRNDELALYSIFGMETKIGYALDGLPLYGVGNAPVDQCGGRVVSGQYRYELQRGSNTMINCFAAAPMALP